MTLSSRTPSASSPASSMVFGPRAPISRVGSAGGRPVERHVVQLHVAAVDGHGLPVQQGKHGRDVLVEQRHRRLGARTDLAHPLLHAVPERHGERPGPQPGQGRDLHRRQSRVPQRHRQQPDPHVQPLRPRQGGGGAGQTSLEEAVLPEPQLIDAAAVGLLDDPAGGLRAGTAGRKTMPRVVATMALTSTANAPPVGHRAIRRAPGGIRTHTGRCLRPLPLPLGYRGLRAQTVPETPGGQDLVKTY